MPIVESGALGQLCIVATAFVRFVYGSRFGGADALHCQLEEELTPVPTFKRSPLTTHDGRRARVSSVFSIRSELPKGKYAYSLCTMHYFRS